jgi:hypothetical protein
MSKPNKGPRNLGTAVAHTRRLLGARKGPPTEADRPVAGGRPPRVLDGQLDIDGNVHRTNAAVYERQEENT